LNDLQWKRSDLITMGTHILLVHNNDVNQVSMACAECAQIFLLGEFHAKYQARLVVKELLDELGF
jgi:hypothetical protein